MEVELRKTLPRYLCSILALTLAINTEKATTRQLEKKHTNE